MTLTASTMLPLGTAAPDFTLMDTITDKMLSLSELKSDQATVIMFICNHCPYVIHIQRKLVVLANTYLQKGVRFIAISANDAASYPQDGPKEMTKVAETLHYPFPYLYDATQDVARAYHAACTPDIFVFDRQLACVYRGEFDGSRPGNTIPVTGAALAHALDQVLAGKTVAEEEQRPSMGCNIKWRK